MDDGVQQFDPDYGWERAVPTPFWTRSWRTLFRWRASCPEHGIQFGNSVDGGDAWREHYLREH